MGVTRQLVERFSHTPEAPEKHCPFPEEIGDNFAHEIGAESYRRTDANRPGVGDFLNEFAARFATWTNGATGVDSGAFFGGTLDVERPHRRPHTFGRHHDKVMVCGKLLTNARKMSDNEAVRDANNRSRLQGREELFVDTDHRAVRDEANDQIRFGSEFVGATKSAVSVVEPSVDRGLNTV